MKSYLILVASVVLGGCSNTPSSSDVEKALEASVGPCENVEIVDVSKTNGYQEEGLYRVEYKAALEVKEKSELKKIHDMWRDEYEQLKAQQQAHKEFEAQVSQLQQEAEVLRAAVGPEPDGSEFNNLEKDYQRSDAHSAAKLAWRERRYEAAKPKLQEIEQLQQQWLQRPKFNFVVVGNESKVTTNFFYKGCPQQAMEYVSAAIPGMPYDSYGIQNPESRLSFARADLNGEMRMRKTENGWQKM